MKSFNKRVLEAKSIAELGKVVSEDKYHRAKTTIVPGSSGSQNHGILRRFGNGVITAECRKITGAGHDNCLGNYRSVCRHSLASVMLAIKHQGFLVNFRRNKEDAKKLAKRFNESVICDKFGDPIIMQIHSHQLDNRIKVRKIGNGWVSWYGCKEPTWHKQTFTCIEDAINHWKEKYSIYMIVREDFA